MDRVIEKKSQKPKVLVATLVLGLLLVGYLTLSEAFSGRSLVVNGQRLSIAEVNAGAFEDFIPLRARVAPLKTVFLDAVQGGRIEEVLLEDGASVSAGQAILRLSNSDLQLSVMSTESRVMEQLNAMRDQELRLQQNRLHHRSALVDINYAIRKLERELPRQEELFRKGHTSQATYEDFIDELQYMRDRRQMTLESQRSDEKMMEGQLAFFKDKTSAMEANLAFARRSLDELNVRAPIAGKLSGFDVEVGQNISRGTRIGQIDDPAAFKLIAEIDEFYLGRVDLDQPVSVSINGSKETLRVSKIYPNVNNGRFTVDLHFEQSKQRKIRRGQTLQTRLTLGATSEAILIPNGAFYPDTGGQWIFVLSQDGQKAYKRQVSLGRRNQQMIEVLSGLSAGESVIVSAYSDFIEMDELSLDSND